jgi:CRP/FNR family transcriptional regulator, polysaccharide utilization system transcription regulator
LTSPFGFCNLWAEKSNNLMTAYSSDNGSRKTDNHGCMNCAMRCHSLFSELSQPDLISLNKNRYSLHYKKGETIFKEGAKPIGLNCLNQGKVKIVREGVYATEQIVSLKKPVDFIGLRALVSEENYSTSAIALEDSFVCVINKNDFFKVFSENQSLTFKIIRLLAQKIDTAEKRLINLTQKHMRARMADALLLIRNTYGTETDDAFLNASMKRSEIAAIACMTTANAIRVLSAFAKEKLIEVEKQQIKIKDLKVLKEISLLGR